MLKEFLSKITKVINMRLSPAPTIPMPLLLLSSARPGMSAIDVAMRVLAKKKELGLPVGDYDDGTPNVNDLVILEIIKQIIAEIQENARITVVIPPGTQVVASGGNAGGPVIAYGSTIIPTVGYAVMQ